jgi:predicted PurR-regulated permease PerM
MGLNPAIILLSLSVWGTLLGFLGLIIALPLTTLLLSYYDRYVVNRVPLSATPDTADDAPKKDDE